MIYAFLAVILIHFVVLAADIYTTMVFLARGWSESKDTLSYKFMLWFGGYWYLPKIALSLLATGLMSTIYALGYPGTAIVLLVLPTVVIGTLGVFQNYTVIRDHLGGW